MENNQTIEKVSAHCDICDNTARAEKAALESLGWFIGSREEFCPKCND